MPENDPSNPWRTLETRAIYENPWIALREDQVIRPDGQHGIYGVVHFKNRAVGVLPVDHLGRVWLVGQFRYPLMCYSWEIPEGGGHGDEHPEKTAERELREETGLTAGRVELISTAHLSNSVSDELAYIYRATDLTRGKSNPDGNEQIDVRLFDWDDAWKMYRNGEITDSMSVIAILHEALRRTGGSTV